MRIFETEILRHLQLKDFRRETVDRVLDLINGCDRGEHDFSLLDQDPEALSCFRAIIWGPFVVPPPQPSARKPNGRLPDGSEHGKELCHSLSVDSVGGNGGNNGILTEPTRQPGQRGPKFHKTPDDLIIELSDRGQSVRQISRTLEARGLSISYRTIHRRLVVLRSIELPLFKN
jgi:hypothetical protein